jgi:hypothetical protein
MRALRLLLVAGLIGLCLSDESLSTGERQTLPASRREPAVPELLHTSINLFSCLLQRRACFCQQQHMFKWQMNQSCLRWKRAGEQLWQEAKRQQQ